MGKEYKEYVWNLIAKKLAGEASPADLQELETLLRNNPELHYSLQTIADLWEHTHPTDKRQAEEAFGRHLDRIDQRNIDFSPTLTIVKNDPEPTSVRRPRLRKLLLVAPLAILVAATAFLVHRSTHPSPTLTVAQPAPSANRQYTTHSGSRTVLTLPDNTRVWLNAGSHIECGNAFGAGSREVSLTGEAFFDVAPDAAKPFVIHTKTLDVRVLGTSFNLKSYPSDKTTEATLIHGSIEVSIRNRPSNKIILKPNQKLVVANDDSLTMRKTLRRHEPQAQSLVVLGKPTYEAHTGAMIETSWVDNKLIFQDEEFADLAKQMERWYGVSIQFDDPRMEEFRFTGSFEKETIRQALDALKLTARFDFTIDGNQVTIHN